MKTPVLISLVLFSLVSASQTTTTRDIENDVMEVFKTHAFPGDSLSGFDESTIRVELISKGVINQELENHIKQLKRDFIKIKYYRKDEDHK